MNNKKPPKSHYYYAYLPLIAGAIVFIYSCIWPFMNSANKSGGEKAEMMAKSISGGLWLFLYGSIATIVWVSILIIRTMKAEKDEEENS